MEADVRWARAPDSLAELKNEIDRLLCQQPK